MKRKILIIGVVLIVLLLSSICYWMNTPPDPDLTLRMMELAGVQPFSNEKAEYLVEPERIADNILHIKSDVVEIGLFALDFQEEPAEDGSTLFTGIISNLGDLPITGISATIWLEMEDGIIVDWVALPLSTTTLEIDETIQVTGRFNPGEHAPRLLQETLYFSTSGRSNFQNTHFDDVITTPRLENITNVLTFTRLETIWTHPDQVWENWSVVLSCDGD